MKKESGVTLVSLVITIIVLLILAGITISLTVGQDGIITRAQQAGKNYLNAQEYEQLQLSELTNEMGNVINSSTNIGRVQYNSEFRKNVVAAIKNQGVETLDSDTDEVIIGNIGKIFEERTKIDSELAVTADNITQGKQAYVNGQLITGNGVDNLSYYESGKEDLHNTIVTVFKSSSGSSTVATSGCAVNYTFQKDLSYGILVCTQGRNGGAVFANINQLPITITTSGSYYTLSKQMTSDGVSICSVIILQNIKAGDKISIPAGTYYSVKYEIYGQ